MPDTAAEHIDVERAEFDDPRTPNPAASARLPWVIELRSQDLPAADRFGWWSDLVGGAFGPTLITSPLAADFRARAGFLPMGQVMLSTLGLPTLQSKRTWSTIRQADPELLQIALITGGSLGVEQHRNRALVGAGDIVLYDSSHPYDAWVGADWPAGAVQLHLPKREIPVPPGKLRPLLARRWPSGAGLGAVLGRLLEQLAAEAENLAGDEAPRLGSALADVSAAFLADLARTEGLVPPETRRSALLQQIRVFIDRSLADPALSPTTVAAAHHISVRHLHQLFQAEEQTVAALIRTRRLERCRADLAEPGLPAAAVGARWGFPDPAVFSRAFSARYGVPPGEYRRRSSAGRRHDDGVRN
ncbi:helix-turn-helix domain-containing protein [Plantactinospora siamensis]|uniref:Helix-turn-helix domain-containing protein n=1 Tax=Plantactinospora siamensis TaxID=555372 RepID=A0ABV6NY48_9ACTN